MSSTDAWEARRGSSSSVVLETRQITQLFLLVVVALSPSCTGPDEAFGTLRPPGG